jgi:hypothetical protein
MNKVNTNHALLAITSHSGHNGHQISRTQLLKYLLLAGITVLVVSIVDLQTRSGHQTATPSGLPKPASPKTYSADQSVNISAS